MKKRISAIVLAVVLCLAVALPALAIDDYPDMYKYAPKDSITDEWRFYNRECVSFVAWCLSSRNGLNFSNYTGSGWWGNANTWDDTARSLGYRVDQTPAVGAVAYWDAGYYGHVAWVAAVDGDNVTIEEYNYDGDGTYHTRTISASTPAGYIHIKDLGSSYKALAGAAATPSVTFKAWEDEDYTYVTETEAVLGQEIRIENGYCSKQGLYLYDADGKILAAASQDYSRSSKVWFSVNEDCDYQLEPGTVYKYVFYAVVDDITYKGEEGEFRTPGDFLELDKTSVILPAGSSAVIYASAEPATAGVTWYSSNKAVATVSGGRISALSAGSTVITARVGEASAACTVTVYDEVHFPTANVYTPGQFSDVPEDKWFAATVASGYELGLIKGLADSFNPYGNVTVAEAVTMAARIHSIYATGKDSFEVSQPWYKTYLDYAYANGIIDGELYAADVTAPATRAQFAQIMAAALPDEGLFPINQIADGSIPDVSANAECAPAVYKLYRAGILGGANAEGTFRPNAGITRAEASAILSRMAESDNRLQISL